MKKLPHTIETNVFRTGSAPHVRNAAERFVARWWWLIIMPFVAQGIYSLLADDVRWLIVAIAIILLLIPAVIMFGYFVAVSNADAVAAMSQRKATFMPDGTIKVNAIKPVEEQGVPAPRLPEPQTITPDKVTSVTFSGKHLKVTYDNASHSILIPLSAFSEADSPAILARAFGNHEVNS